MREAVTLRAMRSPADNVVPLSRTREKIPDPRGLDDLFRSKSRYVAAIAFRLLGRDDEVDDVVQGVFVACVQARDKLDPSQSITGWLATVTVRVCGKRLRRRRLRRLIGLDGDASYENVAAPDADPALRIHLERVYRALDRLPWQERVAWTLKHVEGEPLEVVANRCECSLATAKRRVAAAHETLRKELGDD